MFEAAIGDRVLNVTATGRRQARSISSGLRVTDDAMTYGETLDWPMTRAPVPSKPAAIRTPKAPTRYLRFMAHDTRRFAGHSILAGRRPTGTGTDST